MENFYYECIYDVLRNTARHEEKTTKLNHLNAKITKLHSTRLQQFSTMMNLTDWRERDQRFSTFYRCENDEYQDAPKCAGRSWEYQTDNKRHHEGIHNLPETKI